MIRPRRAKPNPWRSAINITLMFCIAAEVGVILGLIADKIL